MLTYKQLIKIIEEVASKQEYIHTIIPENPYDANELRVLDYGVFSWSPNNVIEDSGIMSYSLNLFIFDRLDTNKGNKLQIQSTAINVLKNILDTLQEEYDVPCERRVYTTFYETFKDICAGAYVTVTFNVETGDCPDY